MIGGKMVCNLIKSIIMSVRGEYLADQLEGKGRVNAIPPRLSEPL
jgi:hypothetical protein